MSMYGLVLEGGGAKGSYQIGAFRAFKELQVEIKGVAGTSIGALNGAMFVQGDIEKAYQLWYDITPASIFNVDQKYLEIMDNFEFNQESIKALFQRARNILKHRGIDISQIKDLLYDNIDEKTLRNSGMDFGLVTISLSDFKPLELYLEDIVEGKLVSYLLASAYYPVFKLEKVDGKYLIDGGFYNNLPINLLASRGYQDIIVIRTFEMGKRRVGNYNSLNITYVAPEEDLGGFLDFNQEKIRYNLKLGYYDTLRVFKNLMGHKYYLESTEDENYYFDYLLNTGKDKIIAIGEYLGLEDLPYRRMLFEHIVPRLISLLDLEEDCSYQELVIAIIEAAAGLKSFERFKIYQLDELQKEIEEKYQGISWTDITNRSPEIPLLLRQYKLLSRTVKAEMLEDIVDILFN